MSDIKRRDFLKVLGLTGASAGAVGCAQEPAQRLIPYLVPPDDIIPGLPTWYASTCRECPGGCGFHVKVREGRPIKLEGNPEHPVNAGALCALGQASLQGLYNPDRVTGPLRRASGGAEYEPISWDEAESMIAERVGELRRTGGADRIYLLTDSSESSLDALFDRWLRALGSTNRVVHETFDLAPLREANRLSFGLAEIPQLDFDRADLILSFGAGFLEWWISPIQHARLFGEAHGFGTGDRMARFIHVAPRLSLTGSNADEWLAAAPGSAMELALAMTRVLVAEGRAGDRADVLRAIVEPFTPERAAGASGLDAGTIERVAHEFADSPASLALPPGHEMTDRNATASHIAVNLLNYAAGNLGRTVRFGPGVRRKAGAGLDRMRALTDAMRGGEVELALIHGDNPAFSLPPDLDFAGALQNVGLTVSFSSFLDETSARADLILPDHHALESWGDHFPREGVYSLLQPTIQSVFDTRQTGDVLLSVAERIGGEVARQLPWTEYREYLRDSWQELHAELAPDRPFEDWWREAVARGGVWREVATRNVTLNPGVADFRFEAPGLDTPRGESFALVVYPSPTLYDGRGANRPWLQELPDPMTKVVWNSWIEIHPDTAEALGVETGDIVEVRSPTGRLEVAAYVYQGIRPDTVAIPFGQGHEHYGRYARERGVNPIGLLPAVADAASGGQAWLSTRVQLSAAGRRGRLVVLQGSDTDHGREVAELMALPAAIAAREQAARERQQDPEALVSTAQDADPKSPYRWGMAIDLSSCLGCAACVTACYAENNIPVVGEEGCAMDREMSWIRIERYWEHLTEGAAHGHGETASSNFEDRISNIEVRAEAVDIVSGQADPGQAAHGGAENGDGFHTVHLPMLCQHCGNAPCEPVCPVYATYHNPEGLNVQVYNRCVGTRYCSNNCPYKVRRFEWYTYEFPFPLNLQLNPDVTVREKGVMEKCTFCVQRIQSAKNDAAVDGRQVADGDIVPACAQTCPTDAIVFGNLRDPNSRVSQLARSGRGYHVLDELNTRPAITYLSDVTRTE